MAAIPEPYVWSEEFETLAQKHDEEHKGLFQGIDTLCKNPESEETLKTVVGAVVQHFKSEEQSLEAAGLLTPDHKAAHDELLKTAGALTVPIDAQQQKFLKNWLVVHIKGTDCPTYKGKLDKQEL